MLVDNLGSTNVILNALGEVEQTLEFDPWGMRTNAGDTTAVNAITNRGYTGHEMDDEIGLTNMNARIYDPYLGRFLSADPVLPDAYDMQAYNRYAYVLGNPLKYVDPTGNSGCEPVSCIHFPVGGIGSGSGSGFGGGGTPAPPVLNGGPRFNIHSPEDIQRFGENLRQRLGLDNNDSSIDEEPVAPDQEPEEPGVMAENGRLFVDPVHGPTSVTLLRNDLCSNGSVCFSNIDGSAFGRFGLFFAGDIRLFGLARVKFSADAGSGIVEFGENFQNGVHVPLSQSLSLLIETPVFDFRVGVERQGFNGVFGPAKFTRPTFSRGSGALSIGRNGEVNGEIGGELGLIIGAGGNVTFDAILSSPPF